MHAGLSAPSYAAPEAWLTPTPTSLSNIQHHANLITHSSPARPRTSTARLLASTVASMLAT